MEDPPTGFRFYPTEEELVGFYLQNQLEGKLHHHINRVIPIIDINGKEPWDLPTFAGEKCRGETEQWFFFSARQERELRGGRANRTTSCGYWKATGSPSYVYSKNKVIGIKKTMVFCKGKAPFGRKTKWKMHEYKAIEHSHPSSNTNPPELRHEFSLCRVYVISGSFCSFDRRPLEMPKVKLRVDHTASTSQQVVTELDRSSLCAATHSEGVGRDHDDALIGGSSGTNWNNVANNNGVDEPEVPLWEWDQLHWI